MKFSYDYGESILLLDKRLTKAQFLEKCGATKKFSEKMFSRMFDSIYSELVDVEQEYAKYYALEYSSVSDYLFRKLNISKEVIREIDKLQAENENLQLFIKDDFSYGDYQIVQFAFSDTMYDRISDILTLKSTI